MQGGVAIVVPSAQICPSACQGRDDGGIAVVSGRKMQGGPAFLVLPYTQIRPAATRAVMTKGLSLPQAARCRGV